MALIHYVKDYNGLFFGELSLFELQGMRFVARPTSGLALNFKPIDIDVLVLSVDKQSNMLLDEHDLYVLDKADLKPLGNRLSLNYPIVSIGGMARLLSFWEQGAVTKHRTLDEFYTNITSEERERYSY